jgi:hypothetical protein
MLLLLLLRLLIVATLAWWRVVQCFVLRWASCAAPGRWTTAAASAPTLALIPSTTSAATTAPAGPKPATTAPALPKPAIRIHFWSYKPRGHCQIVGTYGAARAGFTRRISYKPKIRHGTIGSTL